jgi:arginine repressor
MPIHQARREALLKLIRQETFTSQRDLAHRLKRLGFLADQAIVSRELAALGVVKVEGPQGPGRYVAPESVPSHLLDPTLHLLRQFVTRISAAGNILLVKTKRGRAEDVAAALARLQVPESLDMVAGIDGVVLLIREEIRVQKVAGRLRKQILSLESP